jgi:hypothetical protein
MAMKNPVRSCPVCGHPVGAKRWFWGSWIWARWHCVSCGTLLRFDSRRRWKVALIVGLFNVLIVGVEALCAFSRLSPWTWVIPLVVISAVGTIFIIVRYDRIIVAYERKDDSPDFKLRHYPPCDAD